jgi:hypothetical protein
VYRCAKSGLPPEDIFAKMKAQAIKGQWRGGSG